MVDALLTIAPGEAPSVPQWLMTIAMGILSWAAMRIVKKIDTLDDLMAHVDKRVVRIEAKIDNGLTHSVSEMKEGFKVLNTRLTEHIEDEEVRILSHQRSMQREGQSMRTRSGDGEPDDA
jgi:hypothetical protein